MPGRQKLPFVSITGDSAIWGSLTTNLQKNIFTTRYNNDLALYEEEVGDFFFSVTFGFC